MEYWKQGHPGGITESYTDTFLRDTGTGEEITDPAILRDYAVAKSMGIEGDKFPWIEQVHRGRRGKSHEFSHTTPPPVDLDTRDPDAQYLFR